MTVLVIGKFDREGFGLHIADALGAMGHAVVRYEPGVKYDHSGGVAGVRWQQLKMAVHELAGRVPVIQRWREQRLLETASATPIDLTIVCHDFLLPRTVRRVRELSGAPIVLWFPDHVANFGRSYFLNTRYDALFFKDPYITWALSRMLSRRVYYLPECCNPSALSRSDLTGEERRKYGCDIATAGNMYPYRGAFFEQLKGYRMKIWGNPAPIWMDSAELDGAMQRQYVVDMEKAKAFLGAKIVVNSLNPAEIWGVNARAFEVAGAGGFQLIDWRPGLQQLFDDGSELVSFRSMRELKRTIDFYLERDDLRHAIAERGRARALREHTYAHRLTRLFDTVFGDENGFPMPEVSRGRHGVTG